MERLHTTFRAMGSPCELQLISDSRAHLEESATRAIAEVERIETKYSRYRDDSILSEINRSAGSGTPVEVDEETAGMLDYAETLYQQSDGLFDITSGILRRAWDFKSKRVPTQDELDALLPRVGWRRASWQRPRFMLPSPDMEIDFGGFGKEYAADRVADVCRQAGIRFGLVNLGGDLCVIGAHPDGSPWQIGIQDPHQPGRAMATLPLSYGSIASSGNYERFMEVDGKRYDHLLDPSTGWPVEGGLAGVSVVGERCLIAGTATTVAMLKGREGPRWLVRLGLPHLWIDDDGRRGGSLWPESEAGAPRSASAPT